MTGKMKRRMLLCGILSLAALLLLLFTDFFGLLPGKTYTAEDFGIEIIKSTVDFNQNGIDDSTDILRGAQADAKNRPKYDGGMNLNIGLAIRRRTSAYVRMWYGVRSAARATISATWWIGTSEKTSANTRA